LSGSPRDGRGKSRLGHLYLTGDIVLFPGDGQHRLKSEFEAIKADPELAGEELPVVLIPYESPEQVRQLFSDLNLNAKPISKTIGYEFETRDPLVLVTKALPQRVPLFDGRINRVTNSLPKTSKHVVTLGTLVTGSRAIVGALAETSGVPKDDYLADQASAETDVAHFWNTIVDAFAPYWSDVLNDVPGAAGLLREEYVFPHGLGWLGLAHAAAELIREYASMGQSWEPAFEQAVQTMDWQRVAPIWEGNAVIHDPAKGTNRVNNTGPAVRQMAAMVVSSAKPAPTP
jgi:DNA sulfur modification protein DndB